MRKVFSLVLLLTGVAFGQGVTIVPKTTIVANTGVFPGTVASVTWTLIHHTTNFTCSATPCNVTIPALTAGNGALFLSSMFNATTTQTITGITLSGETPVHCPSQYADQNYSGTNHEIADCFYIASAVGGGGTTVAVTWTNTGSGAINIDVDVLEFHRSVGSATLETCGGGGATACTSLNSNVVCTSCTGPTPTVTAVDFVAAWNANENVCSAVASPFNTSPSPDVDSTNVTAVFSWSLSQSSGNPAVYTCTSGKLGMSTIAFK